MFGFLKWPGFLGPRTNLVGEKHGKSAFINLFQGLLFLILCQISLNYVMNQCVRDPKVFAFHLVKRVTCV